MLVFFDPMGQALCKRTLNIVESLNETHGDRLRFYLSKADEAGGESDRQVIGPAGKKRRRDGGDLCRNRNNRACLQPSRES